jgi:hypothetical protein
MHKRIIAERGLVDDAEEEGQKGLPCDICKTSFPTPIRLAEHRRTQKHKDMATKMGVEEEEEVRASLATFAVANRIQISAI